MRVNRNILFGLLLISSCSGPEQTADLRYIDLKGYFEAEAARMEQSGRKVDKTVSRNGSAESKTGIAPDWRTELSLFIESDINKPAWKTSYSIREDSISVEYEAIGDDLRTRLIKIMKDTHGDIREVSITNQISNRLYSSSEELSYIPDSLYKIFKKQDVIVIGQNEYEIKGLLQQGKD
jgi:hypothetical protein